VKNEPQSWRRWLLCAALFAGIACALGSCATRAAEPTYAEVDKSRDEIRALWLQIRDWRVEGGMGADPQSHVIRATDSYPVRALRVCPAAPETERCQDVCDLKDAICDHAERICELSREIGDDPWSAEKCASAKASCKEARERCCRCTAEESAHAAPL
jgi:hypothetical protein